MHPNALPPAKLTTLEILNPEARSRLKHVLKNIAIIAASIAAGCEYYAKERAESERDMFRQLLEHQFQKPNPITPAREPSLHVL